MADAIIRDWVTDYRSLRSAEIHSFASTTLQNNDLIQAVFTALEEKRYHQEFLEPICKQLFSFYRSRDADLQRFARQYIPTLIGIYLSNVAKGYRKDVRCVEVLLLEIYNLEVLDSTGKPANLSFRIPSISKPSIYHEPMSLSHSMLTEHALSTLEYADCRRYTVGPYAEVEKINASNRLHVMTVLMWLYNQHIGYGSTFSHISVCKMCAKVVKQGFNRSNRSNFTNDCSSSYGNPHPRPIARIPLSSPFLLEIVHAVYFAMFNGLASAGLQSLEELHSRAMHEMLPDVLLATNAIRNSLKVNPSGQPNDGPMGISIALSPTTVVSSVSRALTNASFRTKKLPDDIPIQVEGDTSENHQLSAINEEENSESVSQPGSTNLRPKKQGCSNNSSYVVSAITKVGVLQLRKDKGKKKEKDTSYSETNGNGKSVSLTTSSSNHSDITSIDQNSEEIKAIRYSSSDQVSFRNAYSFKIESLPKSSLEKNLTTEGTINTVEELLDDAKCDNNHGNQDMDAVLTNEVKFILQPSVHKSESANGIQSSSMQTAV